MSGGTLFTPTLATKVEVSAQACNGGRRHDKSAGISTTKVSFHQRAGKDYRDSDYTVMVAVTQPHNDCVRFEIRLRGTIFPLPGMKG